jgi:hypothetical protein
MISGEGESPNFRFQEAQPAGLHMCDSVRALGRQSSWNAGDDQLLHQERGEYVDSRISAMDRRGRNSRPQVFPAIRCAAWLQSPSAMVRPERSRRDVQRSRGFGRAKARFQPSRLDCRGSNRSIGTQIVENNKGLDWARRRRYVILNHDNPPSVRLLVFQLFDPPLAAMALRSFGERDSARATPPARPATRAISSTRARDSFFARAWPPRRPRSIARGSFVLVPVATFDQDYDDGGVFGK